ncbi:hypothetical protein RFI_15989, partial [Reticulomyxa filosa]
YQQLERKRQELESERRECETFLNETKRSLQQLQSENNESDQNNELEKNRYEAEKVHCEQRLDDASSTLAYVQRQIHDAIAPLKHSDSKMYQQFKTQPSKRCYDLATREDIMLCHLEDVEGLEIPSLLVFKVVMQYMINEQIHLKTTADEYRKTVQHLERLKKQMQDEFDNGIRQKNVLIEKLQNTLQLQQQDDDILFDKESILQCHNDLSESVRDPKSCSEFKRPFVPSESFFPLYYTPCLPRKRPLSEQTSSIFFFHIVGQNNNKPNDEEETLPLHQDTNNTNDSSQMDLDETNEVVDENAPSFYNANPTAFHSHRNCNGFFVDLKRQTACIVLNFFYTHKKKNNNKK